MLIWGFILAKKVGNYACTYLTPGTLVSLTAARETTGTWASSHLFWNVKRALQGILGHCIPGFLDYTLKDLFVRIIS